MLQRCNKRQTLTNAGPAGFYKMTENLISCKVVKLTENAKLPTYATPMSAGFDFYAINSVQLCYGSPVVIRTGLSVEVPENYGLFIFSRSGHGFNENVRLANCVGVIDSDYRGEVLIKLTMDFPSWQITKVISEGDRVAQGVILPCPKIQFVEADSLSVTQRGKNGLGSTGNL